MKIPQLAKSLATILALPVCGTALTAGAVSLDTAFTSSPIVQQQSNLTETISTSVAKNETLELAAKLGYNLVSIDAQGNLNGRILSSGKSMQSANVTLIRSGKVVANLKSDPNGNFQASGIGQGIYTVIVSGEGHYSISGVNVLAHDSTAHYRKNMLELGVSEASARSIHELVSNRDKQAGPANATQVATLLYGENVDHHEASAPRTVKGSNYRIAKAANGNFVGRLAIADQLQDSEVSEITVYLLKNNDLISMSRADKFGVFEIADLASGAYTLVASNGKNVLVAGFELTDASMTSPVYTSVNRQDETEPTPTPLTEESQIVESFEGMLVPEEDMELVEEIVEEEREEFIVLETINGPTLPYNDPYFAGGGYGGGGNSGGGGGFGGLGGGMGVGGNGLLPLFALTGIAAVASTDDDNFYRAPRPISGFRP